MNVYELDGKFRNKYCLVLKLRARVISMSSGRIKNIYFVDREKSREKKVENLRMNQFDEGSFGRSINVSLQLVIRLREQQSVKEIEDIQEEKMQKRVKEKER